jgi:hypothetical protein
MEMLFTSAGISAGTIIVKAIIQQLLDEMHTIAPVHNTSLQGYQ